MKITFILPIICALTKVSALNCYTSTQTNDGFIYISNQVPAGSTQFPVPFTMCITQSYCSTYLNGPIQECTQFNNRYNSYSGYTAAQGTCDALFPSIQNGFVRQCCTTDLCNTGIVCDSPAIIIIVNPVQQPNQPVLPIQQPISPVNPSNPGKQDTHDSTDTPDQPNKHVDPIPRPVVVPTGTNGVPIFPITTSSSTPTPKSSGGMNMPEKVLLSFIAFLAL